MTLGELTSFRDADAVWHAHRRDRAVTLCGLEVPGFKPGRRRSPTCPDCVMAARALPVEQTPVFWGWHPVAPPAVVPGAARPDPPVRADGRCHVCKKQRRPERSRRYAGAAAECDPFCSNECARVYHDNPLPFRSIWGALETEAA